MRQTGLFLVLCVSYYLIEAWLGAGGQSAVAAARAVRDDELEVAAQSWF